MSIDGATIRQRPKRESPAGLLLIPLALVLVLVVGTFHVFFRGIRVEGPSMEPVLVSEDRILVEPGYVTPRRGDIVAIEDYPEHGESLLKRVVGLPGDSIEVRDDRAFVNGSPESYTFPVDIRTGPHRYTLGPVAIPKGAVFVMGDNRAVSLDSRDFGAVPIRNILGRVEFLFFPPNRARKLDYGPAS